MPSIGTPAPDFTLASTSGELVSLAAFRGRQNVLIAFYPLAFTSTCTAELCAFTEDFSQFESANTAVLPISVDSIPTLREYREKYAMTVELLSDFKRTVSRAYGVLNDEKYYSDRAYIVVDKAGMVRWTWREAQNVDRRENSELLTQLSSLD